MTYRAKCIGHKARTRGKARRDEFWCHVGFTLTPIREGVTINGKPMAALGEEIAMRGGGIMMRRGEVIDFREKP